MKDWRKETLASEVFAIKILSKFLTIEPESIKHVSKEDEQSPYDLRSGDIRYDVKFANPTYQSTKKKFKEWDFCIRGKHDYCEYFILIGMEEFIPQVVYFIPAKNAPTRHIRVPVSGNSKWYEYKIWNIEKGINYQRKKEKYVQELMEKVKTFPTKFDTFMTMAKIDGIPYSRRYLANGNEVFLKAYHSA